MSTSFGSNNTVQIFTEDSSSGTTVPNKSTGGAGHVRPIAGTAQTAKNRNINAAATTYASATNSATWTSTENVTEVTITPQVNSSRHYSFTNYATAQSATTLVTGAGILHAIIINTPIASATITVYDNTAASGTKMLLITLPAALLSSGPEEIILDSKFSTGLDITTTGTNFDVTFVYEALTANPALLVAFDAPSDATASLWLTDTGGAAVNIMYDIIHVGENKTYNFTSYLSRLDVLPLTDAMRVVVGAG